MTRVDISDDAHELAVRFLGLDALWTFRRTVRIPVSRIREVTVGPRPGRRGLRAPGTHVPGVLVAGTWRSRGRQELWNVRRGNEVVVVELDDAAPLRRLVLEVDEPEALAQRVRAAA